MRVAVFGIGYVGCVSAACLSRDGHQVIGVDIDSGKVEMLRSGASPVVEPGLEDILQAQVAAGALTATTDTKDAVRSTEIAMITVGTPSGRDGAVSTTAVEGVIKAIGQSLRQSNQDYTIVVRSTLLPGILEDRLAPLLAEAVGRDLGDGLHLCNNPEFLRESSAIKDYDHPPYVLVGTLDDWPATDVLQLYAKIEADQIVSDSRTAALVKYACNAFHALKVAFGNEMGSLARLFGADGRTVMDLLCRDNKLNISPAYLRPGFAFGGSCLPKDLRALTRHAEKEAVRVQVLGAILPSNQEHLSRAIEMVQQSGQKRVGIVGITFKAGTDDLRESPYVTFVETLIGRGYDVRIYDPGISVTRLTGRNLAYIDLHLPHLAGLLVESPQQLYEHAELMVLGNAIADSLNWQIEFSGQVIDLRTDLVTSDDTAPTQPSEVS